MQTFRPGDDSDGEADDNSLESIKKRHKRENEIAIAENRENTSAVLELRDMEDELSTLMRLFETQAATVKTMRGLYAGDELRHATANGRAYLDEALGRLDEYKQQTTEMLRRVDTTRKDVSHVIPKTSHRTANHSLPARSTKSSSRWRSGRRRWRRCGGRGGRRSWRRRRTCRS